MNEGSRRASDARLAAEALLSSSGTISGSLTAINYGLVLIFLHDQIYLHPVYTLEQTQKC